ncbi:MAG: MarR family transcriptional regulator [Rhodobacterales bacterium CG2_30_65_12]|nr:MAG: MarR family transcriptional regulator [Rhodobacterales bacterium CG2_30_65_12]
MSDFNLDDFLPYQVAELSRRMSAGFERHYRARFGISVAEWRVVAHLSQQAAVSVREIHERVGMDKPKVSRAASRLEENGYVTKQVNTADRRLVELSLTPKGQQMIEVLAPIAAAYQRELDAALGDEAAAFRAQLAKLTATLAAQARSKR